MMPGIKSRTQFSSNSPKSAWCDGATFAGQNRQAAIVIGTVNPVKHFVFIMRAVLVRGAGLETVGAPILRLAPGGSSKSAD
jgi:hypothetical protein